VDLIGVLSNQDLQGRPRRAVKKLGDVSADSEVREPRTSRQRARRPGWVVTAIVEVLDCETPMRPKDIRAAVELLVGESVADPPSSKRWPRTPQGDRSAPCACPADDTSWRLPGGVSTVVQQTLATPRGQQSEPRSPRAVEFRPTRQRPARFPTRSLGCGKQRSGTSVRASLRGARGPRVRGPADWDTCLPDG
jgi:hypothetical protein